MLLHSLDLPGIRKIASGKVREIFDLGGLSKACAEDGVYEFMFCAPALPITGGVGSPVNPYAVK